MSSNGTLESAGFPRLRLGSELLQIMTPYQCILINMTIEQLITRGDVSYISFWRTGNGPYSESDPLSLCLLKPLVSPENTGKSQNNY